MIGFFFETKKLYIINETTNKKKNKTMSTLNNVAAAQNAINGINLYNSIKKTFNDYTEIQEKTKTWKPGEYSACMIMRAVETSSDNFSVGISYTDNGWLISACIVKGFYAGYYRENVPFDFKSDETAFFDTVYDACVKVLKKETIRNEELALAEERAEARIAEMETEETTDNKVINKPTTLNELVDYFCNDDDYACMVLDDVASKKAPIAELLDVIRCGLLERAIVMTGEEPQQIEPYTILAMNIVNSRIAELYGIEGFDMQPVIDEFGEDKYNEYSDIAENLLYELDV